MVTKYEEIIVLIHYVFVTKDNSFNDKNRTHRFIKTP